MWKRGMEREGKHGGQLQYLESADEASSVVIISVLACLEG